MIDWNRINELKQEAGHDGFNEIIDLFIEESESVLKAIDVKSPTEKILEALHYLKGSSLNIGFKQMAITCAKIENEMHNAGLEVFDKNLLFDQYNASKAYFFEHAPSK